MSDKILLIFEGDKTERLFLDNLKQFFFNDSHQQLYASYGTNIYQLYQAMQDYQGEPVDTVEVLLQLLRNNHQNLENLAGISRRNISQVYLFFDYDGHDTKANDQKLVEMLQHFDNETENGLLYISYPMVEALKHISPTEAFESVCVAAKKNIKYKQLVSAVCHPPYNQHGRYALNQWHDIVSAHCHKLSYLMTNQYCWPSRYYSQQDIFSVQLSDYIIPHELVAVLSAFPVLLIDYYGQSELKQLLNNSIQI